MRDTRLIIVGAGGYATCVADAAMLAGFQIEAFVDRSPSPGQRLFDRPVLGEDLLLNGGVQAEQAVIALGDNHLRQTLAQRLNRQRQLTFPSIVHPRAIVASSAELAEGVVVLAGAVINPRARIGAHGSIYTNAVVEHDDVLADYVTLAPGVALGGSVHIGSRSFVGLGSVVNHGITLGADCVIGSGAAVVMDAADGSVIMGVPGKVRRIRQPGERYL